MNNFREFEKSYDTEQNHQQFRNPILKTSKMSSHQQYGQANEMTDQMKKVTFVSPLVNDKFIIDDQNKENSNIISNEETQFCTPYFVTPSNNSHGQKQVSSKISKSKPNFVFQYNQNQNLYASAKSGLSNEFENGQQQKFNTVYTQMLQTNDSLTNQVLQSEDRNVASFSGTNIMPMAFPLRYDQNGNFSNLVQNNGNVQSTDNGNEIAQFSPMPPNLAMMQMSTSDSSHQGEVQPSNLMKFQSMQATKIPMFEHVNNQVSQFSNPEFDMGSNHGINADNSQLSNRLMSSVDNNFGLKPWLKETNSMQQSDDQMSHQNQWAQELENQMDLDEPEIGSQPHKPALFKANSTPSKSNPFCMGGFSSHLQTMDQKSEMSDQMKRLRY